jgi:hypothetical protein
MYTSGIFYTVKYHLLIKNKINIFYNTTATWTYNHMEYITKLLYKSYLQQP